MAKPLLVKLFFQFGIRLTRSVEPFFTLGLIMHDLSGFLAICSQVIWFIKRPMLLGFLAFAKVSFGKIGNWTWHLFENMLAFLFLLEMSVGKVFHSGFVFVGGECGCENGKKLCKRCSCIVGRQGVLWRSR